MISDSSNSLLFNFCHSFWTCHRLSVSIVFAFLILEAMLKKNKISSREASRIQEYHGLACQNTPPLAAPWPSVFCHALNG